MGKFSTRDIEIAISSKDTTKTFKDLHFTIKITKTLSGIPNIANVTIFNLGADSLSFLTKIYNDDGKTEYTATIKLNDNQIFKGDLVNIRSNYKMGTWTTEIFLNEGYNAYRKVAKVESKKGDTRHDMLTMLTDSLKDVGLNDFDIQALKNKCGDKSILKRVLYNGNVIENIKKLIKDCLPKTDIYVEEDKLHILPKSVSKPVTTELNMFLEPPQLNEQGMRCTTLINYNVKIGQQVTLKAKSYNQAFGNLSTNRPQKSRFLGEGTYKVIEIMHEFDNYSVDVAKTSITGIYLR